MPPALCQALLAVLLVAPGDPARFRPHHVTDREAFLAEADASYPFFDLKGLREGSISSPVGPKRLHVEVDVVPEDDRETLNAGPVAPVAAAFPLLHRCETRMRTPTLRRAALLAVLLVLLLVLRGCTLSPREREEWREDYRSLRGHLCTTYANLEWIARHRGLDTYRLDQDTTAALEQARSHRGCAAALRGFVAAFEDPHLRLEEPWYSGVELWWRGVSWHCLESPPEAAGVCAQMGFGDDSMGFDLDLDELLGFAELPDEEGQPFPAAVLPLPGGATAGFIRIGSFGLDAYLSCGKAAFARYVEEHPQDGDPAEGYGFFAAACDEIVARLAQRVEQLKERGIDALVIDITGNGGGTDWVDPAARILTARPLDAPRSSLLRHPSEVERLDGRLALVARDRAREDLAPGDRALLEEGRRRLEQLRTEAAQSADLCVLFEQPGAPLGLSLDVETECYTSGVFAYLPPGSLAGLYSRTSLFSPLVFRYREGVYDGPLFVLQDENTASASEYFAAMLCDNEAALLIGSRTLGAGCGYIAGGLPLVLPHCGWTLKVPNGSRYRKDGSNEIEGIAPDLPLDLHDREGLQELPRLLARMLEQPPDPSSGG